MNLFGNVLWRAHLSLLAVGFVFWFQFLPCGFTKMFFGSSKFSPTSRDVAPSAKAGFLVSQCLNCYKINGALVALLTKYSTRNFTC
ncbi:MAG: hypothetical protein D8M58_00040 [Calditrichaeota bacterium]|nr:MAG: hypothetical protein DWQ03_07040 [Calditrichota bacterium]MBL1203758.1 hypothetical protein [Calditrichota bacterium]